MINNQMKALSKNIMVLERIEKDYGSLDKFVKKETPNDIANMFNSGKYKLIQVGRAFAYDYLKRVGVNTCKKSSQLERLFGSHRLGSANICGEHPNCEKCKIRDYCNYNKKCN